MKAKLTLVALFAAAGLVADSMPHLDHESTSLDKGYREMYNLEFAAAHNTFRDWKAAHPEDPMGAVSDAAAYLFSEFDRLHILQSEFFTDDSGFKLRVKPSADAAVKQAFLKQLDNCEHLSQTALARNAQDRQAEFARILSLGLRADYLALIEKRYVASLTVMKNARVLAKELLSKDPSYYDAYLAVGVENYMLGIKPAPVRWVLNWAGAQTDKVQGLRELELTAQKGHYLEPFARLLLAVAALRDKEPQKARQLLAGLAQEFPKNELYRRELAQLK